MWEGESGVLATFSPSQPHLLAACFSAMVLAACPPVCCCGFCPAPALHSGWALLTVPCLPYFSVGYLHFLVFKICSGLTVQQISPWSIQCSGTRSKCPYSASSDSVLICSSGLFCSEFFLLDSLSISRFYVDSHVTCPYHSDSVQNWVSSCLNLPT